MKTQNNNIEKDFHAVDSTLTFARSSQVRDKETQVLPFMRNTNISHPTVSVTLI